MNVIPLLGLLLIFLPGTIFFTIYSVFYFKGKKYKEIVHGQEETNELLSIIIPIRKEPIELLDEALQNIHELGYPNIEIIIVSDDPVERVNEIKSIVYKWKNKGQKIQFIWRSFPRGFRTGALNDGLFLSRGKYVYIMDVDSRIDKSFFRKAINMMRKDEKIAAVVARWGGKNYDTRLSEAISSSMKFVIDSLYRGRSALNLPVFPVGTGTLFRAYVLKHTLNGWDEERIQDDLEIGSRMMYHGYKIMYIDSCKVLVEVPRRYKSLRVQQERWAYGSTDVAITRVKHILLSKLPWYAKLESMNYLLQYFPAVLTFAGFVLLSIGVLYTQLDYMKMYWYLGLPWLITALIYGYCYVDSLKKRENSTWRILVNLGRSAAVTTALTPIFIKAILKALLRIKVKYKRTPKGKYEARGLSKLRFPTELVLGVIILVLGFITIFHLHIVYTGLWVITYSLGYLYTCLRWFEDIVFK